MNCIIIVCFGDEEGRLFFAPMAKTRLRKLGKRRPERGEVCRDGFTFACWLQLPTHAASSAPTNCTFLGSDTSKRTNVFPPQAWNFLSGVGKVAYWEPTCPLPRSFVGPHSSVSRWKKHKEKQIMGLSSSLVTLVTSPGSLSYLPPSLCWAGVFSPSRDTIRGALSTSSNTTDTLISSTKTVRVLQRYHCPLISQRSWLAIPAMGISEPHSRWINLDYVWVSLLVM